MTQKNTLSKPLVKRRRDRFANFAKGGDRDYAGRISEHIASFLGTPKFIFWLTIVCIFWLTWNVLAPENLRFDSAALGFTALTLILSLQASYAAPLILFAQNRQTERDKVQFEHDRERAERNLADTEYLAREIATIRLNLSELASNQVSRDFLRSELKNVLESLEPKVGSEPEKKNANADKTN